MSHTPRQRVALANRVVVKVGSSSLTGEGGRLDAEALRQLVDVLAARHQSGTQIVLVTSGAVAAGLDPLNLDKRPRDLATVQAAASVGQGLLIAEYTDAFAKYGIPVGQLLLTAEDTVRRSRYRNAGRTLERLLKLGAVPILNENDALVADELRFGDNDRIAALVANLAHADAMVLLTDVDGLHDGPPSNPGSKRIPDVENLDEIEGIEVGGSGSKVGTGGMVTKLKSVAIATESGIPVVLTTVSQAREALAGDPVGTCFAATGKRRSRHHLWLKHAARTFGRVTIDEGAERALSGGKASLLAAGIVDVEGDFTGGDPISIITRDGREVARGMVSFHADEVSAMQGKSTTDLVDELGDAYGKAVVHLDHLVLM